MVIDNFVDSRPSVGLARASLVYEAPVEAGITRFLAFYSPRDVEIPELGPVRSARPYFLSWSRELGALFVHIGGSPEVLKRIRSQDLTTLNQFFKDQYFWRVNDRSTPYNVFTSGELLREALSKLKWRRAEFDPWRYEASYPNPNPRARRITIVFAPQSNEVSWRYDTKKDDYLRIQDDEVHRDADGQEIRARNIVVLQTEIKVTDEIGRRRIATTGEGEATLYRNGEAFEATWRKASLVDRLRLYDEEGEELAFSPGVTWIEIISPRHEIKTE